MRHQKKIEVYFQTKLNIYNKRDCCANIIEAAASAMELQGRELAMYENSGIDKLITIKMKKVSLLDAEKSEELYKIGYEETKNR